MVHLGRFALVLGLCAGNSQAQLSLDAILSRVAEEAEVLQQNAGKTVTTETLEQRALLPPTRFRPRAGGAAAETTGLRVQVREVVSEYTVAPLKNSDSRSLLEFRQVVSVDGRRVRTFESARTALSLGVQTADERVRKRMLEALTNLGLVDIATDYGLILLAFTKRGQAQMKIEITGQGRIGVEETAVLRWQQTSADAGQLEFRGKQVARRAMEGFLWARAADGLPLRIQVTVEHSENKRTIRDEAVIEYVMSPHGFLTPASVVHRHAIDGQLLTENLYRYDPFKLFSADAEIKFTEIPEPATPTPAPAGKKP